MFHKESLLISADIGHSDNYFIGCFKQQWRPQTESYKTACFIRSFDFVNLFQSLAFHQKDLSLTILNPELGFLVPQRQVWWFWFVERGHGISTWKKHVSYPKENSVYFKPHFPSGTRFFLLKAQTSSKATNPCHSRRRSYADPDDRALDVCKSWSGVLAK